MTVRLAVGSPIVTSGVPTPTPRITRPLLTRSSAFEVVLPPTARLDPVNEPAKTAEILGDTAALGATIIMSGFASESLAHYLEQLGALAAVHAKL
jgi:hypothetical protein